MPVYSMQLDIDNDQLIEDIQQHRNNFPEGEISNVKAWRSSYKTHKQTKIFDSYIDKILDGVDRARISDPESFSRLELCTYKVQDFWALMYEEGDYTIRHTHYPCTWASCYYAYADEDSAPINLTCCESNLNLVHYYYGMGLSFILSLRRKERELLFPQT